MDISSVIEVNIIIKVTANILIINHIAKFRSDEKDIFLLR